PSGAASAQTTAQAAAETAPPAEDAWNLIVFVDNFNIHPANRTRTLRQLQDFLSRSLGPGDRVMLVSYDLGLKIRLPFTSDPAAIAGALAGMDGLAAHASNVDSDRRQAYRSVMTIQEASLSDPQPLPCPLIIAQPAHDYAAARKDEALRTLGGLTVLVNSLSGLPGRKAVLHVSDGIPATPGEEVFQFLAELCGGGGGTGGIGQRDPGYPDSALEIAEEEETARSQVRLPSLNPNTVYDTRALGGRAYQGMSQAPLDAQGYHIGKEISALVAHANAHQVTLYTLQASGAERPRAADADFGVGDRLTQFQSIDRSLRKNYQDSLHALADGTGGRAILGVNELAPELARIQEDASHYLLGFEPKAGGEGKEHKIEVRVKRPGVRLRHRQSYRDKSVMEKTVDRTLASLYYGVDENPLQIGLTVGEQSPGPGGTVSVPIQLKIPVYKLAILEKDEGIEAKLRLLLATRDGEGRASQVRQLPLPIQVPLKEVLHAMGQFYVYTLTLHLPPGEHRVAVAVRDEVAATTSFLSHGFTVGGITLGAAAPAQP
ncbi:MAG TPA: VWA domain-containing protein, partial [Thermoanaerobaculia bacterium]|nr:VWA domain-containing protein [Thermoanaerobaculia bacterium]